MKHLIRITRKMVRLFTGLFLYGFGIVCAIHAQLGLAPWEAFHQGIALKTGSTIGMISILIGILILVINFLNKEKIGIGTIANMIVIGVVIDVLMMYQLVPVSTNLYTGLGMLVISMFSIAFATYLYLGTGLGAGPRDGLMIVVHKKTGRSIRFSRNCVEITVLIVGFLLGAKVGIGTIIISIGMGYAVQLIFKIFKFDAKAIEHLYVDDFIRDFIYKRKNKQEGIEEEKQDEN